MSAHRLCLQYFFSENTYRKVLHGMLTSAENSASAQLHQNVCDNHAWRKNQSCFAYHLLYNLHSIKRIARNSSGCCLHTLSAGAIQIHSSVMLLICFAATWHPFR